MKKLIIMMSSLIFLSAAYAAPNTSQGIYFEEGLDLHYSLIFFNEKPVYTGPSHGEAFLPYRYLNALCNQESCECKAILVDRITSDKKESITFSYIPEKNEVRSLRLTPPDKVKITYKIEPDKFYFYLND